MTPARGWPPLNAAPVRGYDRVGGEAVWIRSTTTVSASQMGLRRNAGQQTAAMDIDDSGACL